MRATIVFVTMDSADKLRMHVTKDLAVALALERESAPGPLSLLLIVEFETRVDADDFITIFENLSIKRQFNLIKKSNPNLKDLLVISPPVTPAGVPFGLGRSRGKWRHEDPPPDRPDDAAGGVLSKLPPRPVKPRSGAIAADRPESC